jgi:hypothetical protein
MVINGEKEAGVARDGDQAEPITVITAVRSLTLQGQTWYWPFALYNIHYGKRDILGTTKITTLPIDQGGVKQAADIINIKYSQQNGKHSRWDLRMGRKIMIPISKCDHGIVWGKTQSIEQPCQEEGRLTVVDIIQMFLWVKWIINNQGTTQPITVLILEVTVIPKRSLRAKIWG